MNTLSNLPDKMGLPISQFALKLRAFGAKPCTADGKPVQTADEALELNKKVFEPFARAGIDFSRVVREPDGFADQAKEARRIYESTVSQEARDDELIAPTSRAPENRDDLSM